MKHPRRRLIRIVAITAVSVVALGAAAVADTVPVTLGVVNGARSLTVTGSNGTAPVGTPTLALSGTTTAAPFGVVVTDLLYERRGYSVNATLSNLYKLGASGVNCDAAIPSEAFNVTFASIPSPSGLEAVLDAKLTFADTSIKDDLLAADPTLQTVLDAISGAMPATVSNLAGVVQELDPSSFANPLMAVADGQVGAAFSDEAAHPQCNGSGAGSPTSVALQTGTEQEPTAAEITTLRDSVFAAADDDTSNTLTAAEAIAEGLLPVGADQPGGVLYEATKTVVKSVIDAEPTLAGLVSETELADTTVGVVADLRAGATDLVLTLIGQSGVYPNLPILNLDTAKDGDPTTGTYHGIMTVTLTDGS